jgi:acetylornithine deacetylase
MIEQIEQLIAAPSISSVDPALDQSNRPVIDLLANWLTDLGWRVELQQVCAEPAKVNLIASLGTGPGGLVLAGHADTVPFDDEGWSSDPLQATERDGKLYGLGTSDMKAFFAVALEAARIYRADQLQRTLFLLATADEEITMAGARALVASGRPQARYAVVGEPTAMRPIYLHKGVMMEQIRVRGHSGHSSDPSLGNSALEGMSRVLDEILCWRAELQKRYRNEAFAVPEPTLNLGRIHGGDAANRICGHCELSIDIRPLPGMSLDALRDALRERLTQRLADSGLELEVERTYPGAAALETSPSSAIVRRASEVTGQAPGSVAFATEAPYYQQLGIEPVVLGPGHIELAHQPDEYIELSSLAPAADTLRALIQAFCVTPRDE